MEGFTYTNIFDTKGIEYLAIITFFLVLIPFWILLTRPVKIPATIRQSIRFLSFGSFTIPQGLFYCKYHSWTYLEKSGLAKIGMDDFVSKLIGEARLIPLKNRGEHVKKGEKLATLNQHGKILNIFSPVTGEIIDLNDLLVNNPSILPDDPYEKGWICKIKPDDWIRDTSSCFFASHATTWMEEEFYRFRDFLAAELSHRNGNSKYVLQDGGELVAEPLSLLPGEIWTAFQNEFLEEKILIADFEAFSES